MGPRPQRPRRLARPHHGLRCTASLERLQTDHIDLYQIHGNDTVTPIDETLRALDDLDPPGPGPLRRRLQLGGLEDRQGAGPQRGQGLRPLRDPAGLLLHRRPRPGARAGPDADRGAARPDGLVAAGRRPAVRQVRPGRQQAARARAAPPSTSRRSTRTAPGPASTAMREIGDAHGVVGGPRRAGLAAGQAARDERDHRRQDRSSSSTTTWPRPT